MIQLNQEYLSQLSALERWAMEYNANVDQFNASLDQWLASYNAQLRQMDLSQYQWEQSFAYQKERDRVADSQWERSFSANRSDVRWQQGITERQLSNDEANTRWQQGITERQLSNDEANPRWQQGITERQLSNDEANTRWQQGITERQLSNDEANTRWQQGITERQLSNDEANARWQQGITERQLSNDEENTRWQRGVTEQQLAASQLSNLRQYVMAALSSGYMVDDATLVTYDNVGGGGVEAVAQNDVHIGGIGVEIAVPKHSLYPSDSPRLVVAPFEAVGEIICEKVKVEVALGGDEAQGRGFRTGEDTRREAYQIPTAVGAFAIARDVLLDGRIDIAVAFQLPAVLDGEGVAAYDGDAVGFGHAALGHGGVGKEINVVFQGGHAVWHPICGFAPVAFGSE